VRIEQDNSAITDALKKTSRSKSLLALLLGQESIFPDWFTQAYGDL
jgi:hypothetical protein